MFVFVKHMKNPPDTKRYPQAFLLMKWREMRKEANWTEKGAAKKAFFLLRILLSLQEKFFKAEKRDWKLPRMPAEEDVTHFFRRRHEEDEENVPRDTITNCMNNLKWSTKRGWSLERGGDTNKNKRNSCLNFRECLGICLREREGNFIYW